MCLRLPSYYSLFTLLLSLSSIVSASPVPQSDARTAACSKIQSSLVPIPNTPPGSSVKGTVPAALAWDCLQSIPLNATAALELVDSLKPYMGFQSTLGYLKNPPATYAKYAFGAVDLLGGLDAIAAKVKGGEYSGEYDFGFELYTLFQSSHDGHLWFTPDVVNKLFSWSRPFPLVSVSEDGWEIPNIFAYSDILTASTNPGFEPSPIVSINGIGAEEYLEDLSHVGSLQDRDALWNTVFWSLPQTALGPNGLGTGVFGGGGRGRIVYPGATTTVRFGNGTQVTVQNAARVNADFTGITSGQSVYDKFFRVNQDMKINLAEIKPGVNIELDPRFPEVEREPKNKDPIPAPGYPKPIVRMNTNELGGYFLDKPGYEDVAVLTVTSFVGGGSGQTEFQKLARDFLTQAKEAGKKKLVIDVSANGGGTIALGYELFAILFPGIEPYGGNRFRAHQAWDEMGKLVSDMTAPYNRSLDNEGIVSDFVSSPMNYRSDLREDGKPFESWAQKYGPHEYNGDKYTTTQRWNYDDVYAEWYSGLKQMTNHGLAPLDLPWKSDDIIVVYDGYCASTCTIFSEFMRQQAGVQTIAMGGRLHEYPIQAVGGTKGTNNWGWLDILTYVLYSHQLAEEPLKEGWKGTEMTSFDSFLPFHRASGPQLNMRDGVRQGDASGLPGQFRIELADCRLYYTADMMVDISAVWRAAADAKFFDKKECVAGELRGNSLRKRATQRVQTKTAKVQALDGDKVARLEAGLDVWTEFKHSKKANGIMIP